MSILEFLLWAFAFYENAGRLSYNHTSYITRRYRNSSGVQLNIDDAPAEKNLPCSQTSKSAPSLSHSGTAQPPHPHRGTFFNKPVLNMAPTSPATADQR